MTGEENHQLLQCLREFFSLKNKIHNLNNKFLFLLVPDDLEWRWYLVVSILLWFSGQISLEWKSKLTDIKPIEVITK